MIFKIKKVLFGLCLYFDAACLLLLQQQCISVVT